MSATKMYDMEENSNDFQAMIYRKVVVPSIVDAKKCLDQDFASYCDFEDCTEEKKYRKKLEKFYLEKREWLKSIYWNNEQADNEKLDMHKMAAILCRSIIGIKPFLIDSQKAEDYISLHNKQDDRIWLVNNYLINYKVAFNAALAMTLFDFVQRLGKERDEAGEADIAKELIGKIGKETKLDYYDHPFQQTHETFYNSIVMDLAINDLVGRDFDYLAYAAIFFQIQQYNYVEFKNEIMKRMGN